MKQPVRTGLDLLKLFAVVGVEGGVLAARLPLALAAAQLVRQQELAPMEFVQQQHLYALRALALLATAWHGVDVSMNSAGGAPTGDANSISPAHSH